jgi:hypothetical protein
MLKIDHSDPRKISGSKKIDLKRLDGLRLLHRFNGQLRIKPLPPLNNTGTCNGVVDFAVLVERRAEEFDVVAVFRYVYLDEDGLCG